MHAVAAEVCRTVESTEFDRDDGVLYRRERSPTTDDHGRVDEDLGYRPE